MATVAFYHKLFAQWPDNVPRRGIVVNTLNEAMPFKGFMLAADALLLERTAPDALGARFVALGFETISAVKFVDPLKEAQFAGFGFAGKLSG